MNSAFSVTKHIYSHIRCILMNCDDMYVYLCTLLWNVISILCTIAIRYETLTRDITLQYECHCKWNFLFFILWFNANLFFKWNFLVYFQTQSPIVWVTSKMNKRTNIFEYDLYDRGIFKVIKYQNGMMKYVQVRSGRQS